jgi:glycosyltransferase involved in cell wall biosynthesis
VPNTEFRGPLAVYAGRLHPSKGLAYLVEAWQTIVGRWPNAKLLMAGEGPERATLMRQIEALDLTGQAVLPGVFDDVDQLLAAADLFVLPSLEGGTSLWLLEGMAAGVPIIAADTQGNRDAIADGRHGLLVPKADSAALSAGITCLLEDRVLASQLAAAARRRAQGDFALAKMVDRHVTLFQGLVRPSSDSTTS